MDNGGADVSTNTSDQSTETTATSTRPTDPSNTSIPPTEPSKESKPLTLQGLVDAANRGDAASLKRLRQVLDERPEIWRRAGDLASHVEQTWIRLAAGRLDWADAVGSGAVHASGPRADLDSYLPLCD